MSKDPKIIIDHYIDSRQLVSFLNIIVEAVLTHKPKNIPAFIVDYLMKIYPDQGHQVVSNIQRYIDRYIYYHTKMYMLYNINHMYIVC